MCSKASYIVIVLLILAVPPFFELHSSRADDIVPPSDSARAYLFNGQSAVEANDPLYLTISIDPPKPIMHAGEVDSFVLQVHLDSTAVAAGRRVSWNPNAATPVIAWLSATRASGITFVDANVPDRSGNQTLVYFAEPPDGGSGALRSIIHYSIENRIKTGRYSIVVDALAELIDGDGKEMQDAAIVSLPLTLDTHLLTKIIMLAVVAVAVFLFIVEWVRVDVVAIIMMILLPELGLLNSGDAFRGLSSNAVIAIIGVMIISFGLNRTGLVNRVIQPLLPFVRKGEERLVVVFSSVIAVISSVMQNTGAAVLFLPAIRLVATRELKIHISRVLMPIGMAAILGGTLTMIGTSPLILLNDILPKGMPKFGFLELTPLGLALVAAGLLYLSTVGMRCLAKLPMNQPDEGGHGDTPAERDIAVHYPDITGPYEISVPRAYRAGNDRQEIVEIRRQFLVNIVAIGDGIDRPRIAPHPRTNIRAGTSLCVYGRMKNILHFIERYKLQLRKQPRIFRKDLFNPSYAGIAEMVIAPRSLFVGKCITDIRFRETFDLNALALHQDAKTYYREMADRLLKPGDAVLIHGTWEQIQSLKEHHRNFIIISASDIQTQKPEKSRYAFFSFLAALILMLVSSFYFQDKAYNPIPLSLCLMVGAVGMIISRVMTVAEAYRAVDWRTVFLLGGLIPLGMAVDQTGTAQWIAKGIISMLGGYMGPVMLLVVLAVLSCVFSMVISNVGACALLVPLGISIANQIGVDPRVAAIVVGMGVSNSFILPTHQVNALYMGPGEYRTKNYIRIGGGLSLIYILVLVTATYLIYL